MRLSLSFTALLACFALPLSVGAVSYDTWTQTDSQATDWTQCDSSYGGFVAGNNLSGIRYTIDAGSTWSNKPLSGTTYGALADVVSGSTKFGFSQYAGTTNDRYTYTIDGGSNWNEVDPINYTVGTLSASDDMGKIWGSCYNCPMAKSVNYGSTWSSVTSPAGAGNFPWNRLSSSSTGSVLLFTMHTEGYRTNARVWISTNAGSSWTRKDVGTCSYYGEQAISPNGQYMVVNCTTMYVSSDYGVTWSNRGTVGENGVSIDDTGRIVATVYGAKMKVSEDAGSTWSEVGEVKNWRCVDCNNGTCFATTNAQGIFKSGLGPEGTPEYSGSGSFAFGGSGTLTGAGSGTLTFGTMPEVGTGADCSVMFDGAGNFAYSGAESSFSLGAVVFEDSSAVLGTPWTCALLTESADPCSTAYDAASFVVDGLGSGIEYVFQSLLQPLVDTFGYLGTPEPGHHCFLGSAIIIGGKADTAPEGQTGYDYIILLVSASWLLYGIIRKS